MPRVFDNPYSFPPPFSLWSQAAFGFGGGILFAGRGQGVAEATRTNHTATLHTLQIPSLPPSSSFYAGPLRAITYRWISHMHLPRGNTNPQLLILNHHPSTP